MSGNPISWIDPLGLWDPQRAADFLQNDPKYGGIKSTHFCAKAVRQALNAGGQRTPNNPMPAADYKDYLPKLGFNAVHQQGYRPQLGDIAVFPKIPSNTSGHIALYDGKTWRSDYIQPPTDWDGNFGAGFFARRAWSEQPFTIYRKPADPPVAKASCDSCKQ